MKFVKKSIDKLSYFWAPNPEARVRVVDLCPGDPVQSQNAEYFFFFN